MPKQQYQSTEGTDLMLLSLAEFTTIRHGKDFQKDLILHSLPSTVFTGKNTDLFYVRKNLTTQTINATIWITTNKYKLIHIWLLQFCLFLGFQSTNNFWVTTIVVVVFIILYIRSTCNSAKYQTHTYTGLTMWTANYYYYYRFMTLCPGLHGWVGTRRINHSGFCSSRDDGVAVASAEPYASYLHFAQEDNHASISSLRFLWAGCIKALKSAKSKWNQKYGGCYMVQEDYTSDWALP